MEKESRMRRNHFVLSALLVAIATLLPAGSSFGQPAPDNVPPTVGTAFKTSEYWLGIVTEPVPEALRAQLNLPENQGLLVEQVAPESPAAAAAIQRHDILLKANGKSLTHVGDLIAAVDAAKGKKLDLEVLRQGKPMKVAVTPAKRPEGDILGLRAPTPADAFSKWIEQLRPGDPRHRDYSLFFVRPGVVMARPGGLPNLPGNVTISVTKQGDQPAKIVVTRENEKWEVTEGKLDSLPPDLRQHVEGMLRHPSWHGAMMPKREGRLPSPGGPVPAPPHVTKIEPRKSLEKQLDDMNRRLEEMRKAVDELKKQWPPAKAEAGSGKK
jgi:membrane-associated protease RseP (regulator of RpoE activity)